MTLSNQNCIISICPDYTGPPHDYSTSGCDFCGHYHSTEEGNIEFSSFSHGCHAGYPLLLLPFQDPSSPKGKYKCKSCSTAVNDPSTDLNDLGWCLSCVTAQTEHDRLEREREQELAETRKQLGINNHIPERRYS